MDTQATEMMVCQEPLLAEGTELLRLLAMLVELTDELSRVDLQSAAGDTVDGDLKSVAGAYERLVKRAKTARP